MQTEEFGGNELEVFAEVTENATGKRFLAAPSLSIFIIVSPMLSFN